MADGLEVIFCVGELLEQRQSDKTDQVIRRQVQIGLEGVSGQAVANVVIAYEPVWAIGTGVTATPQQAQQVHAMIRELLGKIYDRGVADKTRVAYGGSVKPANVAELIAQPDIDGALAGGASLKAADFAAIAEAGV